MRRHEDYNIQINYTLHLSQNKEMLHFMKHCDQYQIEVAENEFNTKNHYSYSTVEQYTTKIGEKRVEPPVLRIKPYSLSFGGIYHGVVVAEVKLWRNVVSFC